EGLTVFLRTDWQGVVDKGKIRDRVLADFQRGERFKYILRLFMCMKICKEDIVRVAVGFGGSLRHSSSLDYALEKQADKKLGHYKKLAYLLRAILVDHPFTDGNKKTAMFVAFVFADQHKKTVDRELLKHHILSIATKNINDIRKISERLKNAIH
ncbi:MAG: Fic family protein, partial [Nanoarchaeota archaeon]